MAERKPLNVCDCCTAGTIRWVYLTPEFKVVWNPPAIYGDTVFGAGGWGACRPCAQMIDRGDVQGLVSRAIRMVKFRRAIGNYRQATLVRHFTPIFENVIRVKTARKTPAETAYLQGYADEPMGYAWRKGRLEFIMPNLPLDKELGL